MDRLAAMNAFVVVSDLRGFAPAARRLKLSASAVTRLIAALEDALGLRLLQRTTRSVALTDAGARYLERARRILADVAEAEAAAHAERSVPTGRFVVAAPTVFGRLHVAPAFCAYLRRYPAVTGELTLSDGVANLIDEGVDAAVRIGDLDDSSLIARQVGATRRVLVAAPQYLARHKKLRSAADLSGHALIQFTGLSPTPEWVLSRSGNEHRLPISPRYVTNSADAAILHARSGGGIAMVLGYQVVNAVRRGKLRVVLPQFEPPAAPIHIVYASNRLLSAKVRAFIDLVTSTRNWKFLDL